MRVGHRWCTKLGVSVLKGRGVRERVSVCIVCVVVYGCTVGFLICALKDVS